MYLAGLLLLSVMLLPGCSAYDATPFYQRAQTLAAEGGFASQYLAAGRFQLLALSRFLHPGKDVTIYLEGDGAAWHSRSRLSSDPTPRQQLVLKLAGLHTSGNVAYLARPCQYVLRKGMGENCTSDQWSSERFSEDVIHAMDQAIDELKRQAGARRIHLVGYSGGGAVAALVAAGREDVASLRTIAGNLDHVAFCREHRLSPLAGSLNAADVAASIDRVPQLHFVGGRDRIIPARLLDLYLSRQSGPHCSRMHVVAEASHFEGWLERWPGLLNEPFPCDRESFE